VSGIQFSDRSRFLEYQRCPTARYLGYAWGGTGLRRVRATIPLVTGSAVHAGLAEMLNLVLHATPDTPGAWSRIDVDQCVAMALSVYQSELAGRGLDVELGEDAQWVTDEQRALIEGLVRAYAIAPTGLQALLEQYRILEVEREDVWEGFTHLGLDEKNGRVDFQARADGLLQERGSSDLYVLSFKTASSFDYRQENSNRHDVQGLSEAAVVEKRLRGDWANRMNAAQLGPGMDGYPTLKMLCDLESEPRIMGIQMVYLIKGQRTQGEEGGRYVTQSSLIHPWRKEGITEAEYAWRYKWSGPDVWPDSGKPRGHTLGKGWTRVDIWNDVGVKAWIDMLASGTVQSDLGDPFEAIVNMPLPYFRQDRDVQDWIEQAQNQEARVIQDHQVLEGVRVNQPELMRSVVNAVAPGYRRSCDWPSKCQFQEVCFGDSTMFTSPLSTGLYEIRRPHHGAEAAAFRAKSEVEESNHEAVEDAAAGEN
jgi:hypothetical protein